MWCALMPVAWVCRLVIWIVSPSMRKHVPVNGRKTSSRASTTGGRCTLFHQCQAGVWNRPGRQRGEVLRAGKSPAPGFLGQRGNGQLILHGAHIDPYEKAALVYNHEPKRDRKLLAHRREIKRLANETSEKATTLIPLLSISRRAGQNRDRGCQGQTTARQARIIKRKEMDAKLRRTTMTHRK